MSLNKVERQGGGTAEKGYDKGEGMSACQGENCISAGDTVKTPLAVI